MSEEKSRIDARLSRDALLQNVDPLWNDLVSAVAVTRDKIRNAFQRETTGGLNAHGLVITVEVYEASPNKEISTLLIRLERDEKRITVNLTRRRTDSAGSAPEPPKVYAIVAEGGALRFRLEQNSYSALELAEELIAVRLMRMEL